MRLGARHLPSGSNTLFSGDGLSFGDYVACSREMIAKVRSSADAASLEKIVEGNAPFELEPPPGHLPGRNSNCRRGVLLTHGLTDSPYFMRHLAAFFQENGFRVMAVLLPGHGTQPGDLLDVNWREWARAVAYGADRLAEEADEIFLAGYSAGGTLSLYHSQRDSRVRGLFLFSPALRIAHRAAWANLHKLYSWLLPSGQWVDIKPDADIYKYESFPKNAAAQMHRLIREVTRGLQQRETGLPVFAAASRDDATVDSRATMEFMARTTHPCSTLVLYASDAGTVPQGMPAGKVELVNSVLPARNILGFAHTAIVLPAEDGHYGPAGEYCNCIHYYPGDMGKYHACMGKAGAVWEGEITPQNLRAGLLRRLMYNPHFPELADRMRQWLARLTG